MTKYSWYQDHIISDGELGGEFEQMSMDFPDPWEQSTCELNSIEKQIGLELLHLYGYTKPLEYSFSLWLYTEMLFEKIGNVGRIDISETAVQKARSRFKEPHFFWWFARRANFVGF